MNIQIGTVKKLVFVLLDTNGVEVAGLGSTFTVTYTKNGGEITAGSGTKAEVGSGIYTYVQTTDETDTRGPLLYEIVGVGTDVQRLVSEVVGYAPAIPAGANILTVAEAAIYLHCEIDDANMLLLLPAVDAKIYRGTGRKWEGDSVICQEAKNAAYALLTCLHEGGWPSDGLRDYYLGCTTQLEAMALYYYTFEGIDGAGYIHVHHIHEGDTVVSVTGRVGATGDQSAKFESVITEDHLLQQISNENLENKWFTAYIVPPQEI